MKTKEDSETEDRSSPLYLASWEPKKLSVGKKHLIKVTATLSDGKESETTVTTNREFVVDEEGMEIEGTN